MNPNDSRLLTRKMELYGSIEYHKDLDEYSNARNLIRELQEYLISKNVSSMNQLPDRFQPIVSATV